MKRVLSLLICTVVLVMSIPFGAFAETEEYVVKTVIPDFDFPDNSELFAGYVERAFYPEREISLWGVAARERLSDVDKFFYDWLRENVEKVASGEQTSATFNADSTELSSWTGVQTYFSSDPVNSFFAQFDHQAILEALLSDCPYDLYWFDKTQGYGFGAGRFGNMITQIVAVMSVSEGYQAANYDANDPQVSVGATVSASVANAKDIVEKYASYSDYGKMVAYRDEICDLTDYNFDILEETDPAYGDPWQLIHVFDGDASTKVVCEGYSKAFQYLCDMTDFESADVACYSIVGYTNGGGHMWNIVTMDDGKNYMVDTTNSDSGAVGQNGGLFLNGLTGSVSAGYQATLSTTLTYVYSDDTKALWGTDSESILNLSSTDYAVAIPDGEISIATSDRAYNGEALTVNNSDSDVVYTMENGSLSDYNLSTNWYTDENGTMGTKLTSAPKDAGTYWVEIIATHGTYGTSCMASAKITVTPAEITISAVECSDKEYDGTTVATVENITYSGVISGDDVTLIADVNFLSAEVGEKTQVRVSNITLSGLAFANYEVKESEYILDINPVNITAVKNIGDLNDNGEIDSIDYMLLKRTYFGGYVLADESFGDVNKNGYVDSLDYSLLKRVYFATYVIQ